MSKLKAGDTVRCIKSGPGRTLYNDYTVIEVTSNGQFFRRLNDSGRLVTSRLEGNFVVNSKQSETKATPFGQVRSVTVNKSDIHDVLTQYVRFGLGINATVEKIIDKFPEAVELVLKHEVTA
jgi:hypothetical protein